MKKQDIAKLEKAKGLIKSTDHLYPRYFTEDEIGKIVYSSGWHEGALAKDRYKTMIDAISVMYYSTNNRIDDINRDTFLEVHIREKEITLIVSDTLSRWLREKGLTNFEKKEDWSLKYVYTFAPSEYDKVIEYANYLIDRYEEVCPKF